MIDLKYLLHCQLLQAPWTSEGRWQRQSQPKKYTSSIRKKTHRPTNEDLTELTSKHHWDSILMISSIVHWELKVPLVALTDELSTLIQLRENVNFEFVQYISPYTITSGIIRTCAFSGSCICRKKNSVSYCLHINPRA